MNKKDDIAATSPDQKESKFNEIAGGKETNKAALKLIDEVCRTFILDQKENK